LRVSVHDAVFGGVSDPRNVTLIKLFNLIDIGERSGSGLPSIFEVWKTQGWKMPVLEEQFNPDRTILSLALSPQESKKVAIKSGDKTKVAIKSGDKVKVAISKAKKQAIIDYLSGHDVCKASEISALLEVNTSRTKVYLKELITDGIVISEGGNRNRTYRLK
jgi:predicted HTH transcriptional regulator